MGRGRCVRDAEVFGDLVGWLAVVGVVFEGHCPLMVIVTLIVRYC